MISRPKKELKGAVVDGLISTQVSNEEDKGLMNASNAMDEFITCPKYS